MKRYITLFTLLAVFATTFAQGWVSQASKAVFSVVTYDKDGNVLNNGNGFYISADGTAIADYNLFKNAQKAVVIDATGQKSDVLFILGVNDMYDIVKFQTASKKNSFLTLAAKGKKGDTAYILPYKATSAQKASIKDASDVAGSYAFYTLGIATSEKNVGCPLLNASGQVLGLMQKGTATECYAMAANYANELKVNGLSANDYTLNSIGIMKALPDNPADAEVFLLMAQNADVNTYQALLNQFISKFPNESEGYLKRAQLEIDLQQHAEAEADLKTYFEKHADKADAHYNLGKLYYTYASLHLPNPYNDWNLDKALSETQQAVDGSNRAIYVRQKADILLDQEKNQEAFDTYASLIDSELKDNALVYTFMAQCKKNMNASEDEIIAMLDSAVAQYEKPYGTEAYPYLYARGLRKIEAERYRDGINDLNEVEHIFGGRAPAGFYLQREKAEMKCRMYQQAADDIDEASRLEPYNVEILTEKASVYVTLKDYDKASTAAQQVIALAPDSPYGYRLLGFCQLNQNQKKAGLENLRKAKELGDENADVIIQKYGK